MLVTNEIELLFQLLGPKARRRLQGSENGFLPGANRATSGSPATHDLPEYRMPDRRDARVDPYRSLRRVPCTESDRIGRAENT